MTGRTLIGCMLALASAAAASAQTSQPAAAPVEMATMVAPSPARAQMRVAAVEARVITGRPYSAEATTEFVQVLGDGNKIVRKTTVRIFRDGEGRTRREELAADGSVKSISIYDPVAHVSYVLDPATRTARKAAVRVVFPEPMAQKVQIEREAAARIPGKIIVAPAELPAAETAEGMRKREIEIVARGGESTIVGAMPRSAEDARKESLGQKLIDGVIAEGTKTTTVIPAGSIGNQQEIVATSEQWFSLDLEIFLMTKHSDPRSGETTYSLSNIMRAEPRAGTFDVPADYTIKESSYMRQPAAR